MSNKALDLSIHHAILFCLNFKILLSHQIVLISKDFRENSILVVTILQGRYVENIVFNCLDDVIDQIIGECLG